MPASVFLLYPLLRLHSLLHTAQFYHFYERSRPNMYRKLKIFLCKRSDTDLKPLLILKNPLPPSLVPYSHISPKPPILLISMEKQYQYGPYFFQILQHDFSNHLMIPQECVRQFGIVPQKCRIKGPTKTYWDVSVEEIGTDMYFEEGWSVFAHDHSLKENDFLLFKYCGASQFSVKIFSQNGVEEEFNPAEEEGEKEEEEEHVLHEPEHEKHKSSAIEFLSKSTSPGFYVVMSLSYVTGHKMTVPAKFVRTHLERKRGVKLQVADKSTVWDVKVHYGPRATSLYGGWVDFARDNELSKNDVCVFQLVKDGKVPVMKVSVFRK